MNARERMDIGNVYVWTPTKKKSKVAFLKKAERRNTDVANMLGQHNSYTLLPS